jgi:molecular chaperone GrpE
MTDKDMKTTLDNGEHEAGSAAQSVDAMEVDDTLQPQIATDSEDTAPAVEDTTVVAEEQDPVALLRKQLETALSAGDEFKDALQRERADFSNFRKRTEREKAELRSVVVSETVQKFLPVVDDFERAMASLPAEFEESEWLTGFQLISKKFADVLEQFGIKVINPLGEPFDHNYHDAIGSEDAPEYESGTVIDVLQKGYLMNGKCIRPAIVRVAN